MCFMASDEHVIRKALQSPDIQAAVCWQHVAHMGKTRDSKGRLGEGWTKGRKATQLPVWTQTLRQLHLASYLEQANK